MAITGFYDSKSYLIKSQMCRMREKFSQCTGHGRWFLHWSACCIEHAICGEGGGN